jgi:hypothetical protein
MGNSPHSSVARAVLPAAPRFVSAFLRNGENLRCNLPLEWQTQVEWVETPRRISALQARLPAPQNGACGTGNAGPLTIVDRPESLTTDVTIGGCFPCN